MVELTIQKTTLNWQTREIWNNMKTRNAKLKETANSSFLDPIACVNRHSPVGLLSGETPLHCVTIVFTITE